MKVTGKYFFIAFVFCAGFSLAQNENSKWYFGFGAALDFMTTPPTPLNNSAMNTLEGCASIADAAGNLLFYTDGITVYNASHSQMVNGTGLNGNFSSAQSAIIVRQPGTSTIYYIFTMGSNGGMGLCYSVVDMSLAAGMGSVTVKNVNLNSGVSCERLSATKHTNGADYWIMTHERSTPNHKAYLLTALGVNLTPVVSSIGDSPTGIGSIKFSPNGQKLAEVFYTALVGNAMVLYDFNKTTGVVSNSLAFAGGSTYGCEFSPDGAKLYASNPFGSIMQWDLSAGSNAAILASVYTVTNGIISYAMQSAPNGKIYLTNGNSTSLHVINNPNVVGVGCNFVALGQPVGVINIHSNNMSSFGTGLPAMFATPCLTFTTGVGNITTCYGSNMGSASILAVAGNSGTLSYTWSNGTNTFTTQGISNVPVGLWTVIVSDATNCSTSSIVTITQPLPITVTLTSSSPSVCAGGGVVLTATTSGGTGSSYTYSWSNGATFSLAVGSQTAQGVHIFTAVATDSNNCTGSNTIALNFLPNPTLNISTNQTLCTNQSTTLTASGAITYTWLPNNISNNSISVSPPSTSIYTVTGTGTGGCESTETTQVFVFPLPTFTFNTYTITCANLGSATVTPSGGYGTYNYTWQPTNQNGAVAVGLNPNTYTVTAYDIGTGCYKDSIVTFSSLIPLTGNLHNQSALLCNSVNTGTAYFTNLSGGSGNETYFWNNGVTTHTNASPNNLSAGTWSVTVADALTGCQIYSVFTITQPPALTLNVASTDLNICTGYNFTLMANASGGVGGYSYSWLSAPTSGGQFTVTPSNAGIHTFTANAYDYNNCFISNTINVNVVSPPSLTISLSSPSMCAQAFSGSANTITLTSSGANSYTLQTPNQIANSSSVNPVSELNSQPPYVPAGVTTATLFGSNGVCTVSTTANFSVIPNPTVTVNNYTPVICAGQSYTYTSQGASSYTWSSATPNSTLYTYGNIAITNPSINSVFAVVGGSLGCYSPIVTTSITVNPIPEVYVSPTQTYVCIGNSIPLTASGTNGNTYSWFPNKDLDQNTGNVVFVSPQVQQIYTVIASLNNCTNAAVATVSIKPLPNPNIQLIKNGKCVNDSIVLKGSGGMGYEWTYPNGQTLWGFPELRLKAANESFSGTYTLTVYDFYSCANSKTQSVTINPLPMGFVKAQNLEGCVPLCNDFSFKANAIQASVTSVVWQMNNKNFSGNNINYCFNTAGTHSIQANVRDENSCANSIVTQVIVYPQPIADFTYSPKEPIESLDNVIFTNTSKNAEKFEWNISVINQTSQEKNISALFENTGTYVVALTAQNDKQCLDTIIKSIYVLPDFTIFVPNIFTPNGDNLNETFKPIVRGQKEYRFQIFNRWGQKIFETTNVNQGWDGTYKGEECKSDVYVWKITVVSAKEEKVLNGTVALER